MNSSISHLHITLLAWSEGFNGDIYAKRDGEEWTPDVESDKCPETYLKVRYDLP